MDNRTLSHSKIPVYLGLLFTTLFFLISPHLINGSNDGSYFSMVRNWQKGKLYCTEETFAYLGGVSFAQVGNERLPDRNIGVALLSLPLQLALYPASVLSGISYQASDIEHVIAGSHEDREDIFPARSFLGVVLHLIPAVFGGFSVSLLYLLFNQRFCAPRLNASLAASFALGTCFFPFTLTIFNHIISVFLILSSLVLYFRQRNAPTAAIKSHYVLLGACLGCMSLIDYTLTIFGVGMLIMLALNRRYFGDDAAVRRKNFIRFAIAGAVPVTIYLTYNTIALGRPWLTPYSLHGFYLYAHSFSGLLSGHWLEGLKGLFLSPYRNGIFVRSPLLLFGCIIIVRAIKQRDRDIYLLVSIVLAHWLFTAKLLEWHGGGFYPRYILWSTMILAVFSGFWVVDTYHNTTMTQQSRKLWLSAFALSAAFSIYNSIAHFIFPGRSKQLLLLLEPWWVDVFQDIGVYGIADMLMLVWLFSLIFTVYAAFSAKRHHRFFTDKPFLLGLIGVLCLPMIYALQNPWVIKEKTPIFFNISCQKNDDCSYTTLIKNYYEGFGQAKPDGYMMAYKNVTIASSVMFPTAANQPATIRYNVQPLLHKDRKRLKLDFTLTSSVANYIAIRAVYLDGTTNTLFTRHSDGIEMRSMAMLSIKNIPDYTNIAAIELVMFVDDKTVSNVDARIHAMALY